MQSWHLPTLQPVPALHHRALKWAEHEMGRLKYSHSLSLPLSCHAQPLLCTNTGVWPRWDVEMKVLRSRRWRQGMHFQGTPSEILPLSIIYRLISLGLGAVSFIRCCFDLKIHTVIASGVGEVKEPACVLIRKSFSFFFFFSVEREGKCGVR